MNSISLSLTCIKPLNALYHFGKVSCLHGNQLILEARGLDISGNWRIERIKKIVVLCSNGTFKHFQREPQDFRRLHIQTSTGKEGSSQ